MKSVMLVVFALCTMRSFAELPTLEEVQEAFSPAIINESKDELSFRKFDENLRRELRLNAEFPGREKYIETIMTAFDNLQDLFKVKPGDDLHVKGRLIDDRGHLFHMLFSSLHELCESPELQLRIANRLGSLTEQDLNVKDEKMRYRLRSYNIYIRNFRKFVIEICISKQVYLKSKLNQKEYEEFVKEFADAAKMTEKDLEVQLKLHPNWRRY